MIDTDEGFVNLQRAALAVEAKIQAQPGFGSLTVDTTTENPNAPEPATVLRVADGITAHSLIRFSADGSGLFVLHLDGLKLIDAASGAVRLRYADQTTGAAPDFSPDGERMLYDGAIYDVATGRRVTLLPVRSSGQFSDDHSLVAATVRVAENSFAAVVMNTETGRQELEVRYSAVEPVSSASLSPDGRRLVTKGLLSAQVWDARTGELLFDVTGATGRFSPDGDGLVVVGAGSQAAAFDAATGALLIEPMAPGISDANRNSISAPLWSDDGSTVVLNVTGTDHTSIVWDWERREERTRINAGVTEAVSPDGTLLAVRTASDELAVYDSASGTKVMSLASATGRTLIGVTFGPDSRTVAATDDLGNIGLWSTAPG